MSRGRYLWLIAPFLSLAAGIFLFRSGWLALIFYHALILFALGIYREQVRFRDLVVGFSWRPLVSMLVIACGLFAAITEFAISRDFVGPKVARLVGSCDGLFCFYLLLVNPILEELFWRDLFASKSRRPTVCDFLFGAFHSSILVLFLSPSAVLVVVLAISSVGYGWRQLRWRYSGLILPWMGHVIADAMLIGVVLRLLSI